MNLESISSRFSFLRPAFSAVDWSARIGFEWNFAFLAAICTDGFMHFSGSAGSSFSICHYFTLLCLNKKSDFFKILVLAYLFMHCYAPYKFMLGSLQYMFDQLYLNW